MSEAEAAEPAVDLFDALYGDLRRIAGCLMRREPEQVTLQPTILVHEAWIRIAGSDDLTGRSHADLIALAAHVMRHVLVDYARQRRAAKRGSGVVVRGLDEAIAWLDERGFEPVGVSAAIDRLAARDPQQARIVELRVFAGLSVEETAGLVGVSPRTVKRDWAMAKAWLRQQLADG